MNYININQLISFKFSLLLRANSFNFGLFSFIEPSNIPKTFPIKTFMTSSITSITSSFLSSIFSFIVPIFSSSITVFTYLIASTIIEAHKKRYEYLDITFKSFIILLDRIITIYRKTSMKVENVTHFNKMKKYNKI